jgi:hypothetical protein
MTELERLLGLRDAALLRGDSARVADLEIQIAYLAVTLRATLVATFASEVRSAISAFEEELLANELRR